ncbi:MAG: cysteine desulfurase family protein [Patescibacteria group bacterium]
MKSIYFDNAATTKVDSRVLEAMLPYLNDEFGNAGSIHSFGQNAQSAVDEARNKIAEFFGARKQEIIFTSGATESNNLAIQGVVNYFVSQKQKIHIITSKIEHPAVLETFAEMKKRGIEVDYVGVDENGVLKIAELKKKIKDNTVLISVMYANNEVGSIQPVKEISELVKEERSKRTKDNLPIYLHTDAVQAVNYLPMNVEYLGVDLMTISGHKIYAPKGIGALYIRGGVKIKPITFGGHQEYGLRAGTNNVPGIVALAKALEIISIEQKKEIQKLKSIKDKLIKELENFENYKFNGIPEKQLPNILNISFLNAEGESILMLLDMDGIAISTGSACSSGSLEPSHVLTAMGRPAEWAHGSVRVSLGRFNNENEVLPFIKSLKIIIDKLRKMAP